MKMTNRKPLYKSTYDLACDQSKVNSGGNKIENSESRITLKV